MTYLTFIPAASSCAATGELRSRQRAAQRDRQDRPRDYADGYRAAAAAGPDNRLFFWGIEPLAFYKPCSRTGAALYVIIGAMPCRFLHGL